MCVLLDRLPVGGGGGTESRSFEPNGASRERGQRGVVNLCL